LEGEGKEGLQLGDGGMRVVHVKLTCTLLIVELGRLEFEEGIKRGRDYRLQVVFQSEVHVLSCRCRLADRYGRIAFDSGVNSLIRYLRQ
jgi:hypothetical protein